ncbi:MAG: hypothetical protein U1A78_29035 [Polyangia bacterium]
MKRFIKILHEIATVGITGGVAAILILLVSSRSATPAAYAAIRYGIDHVARWLLLPSLTVVLLTGLLAMAVHPPYQDAGWAWIKALLGVSMLEGTLGGIIGTARDAARLSTEVAAGSGGSGLQAVQRQEWGVLWVILFLSIVNIVLGVWRPKLRRRRQGRSASETAAA